LSLEATYVFNYNGQSETLFAFTDPIEKRRYWSTDDVPQHQMNNPSNYQGTGLPHQVYEPKVVYQTEPFDFSSYQRNLTSILYYLEDVDAYAKANYYELHEDGGVYRTFTVEMLDKLV